MVSESGRMGRKGHSEEGDNKTFQWQGSCKSPRRPSRFIAKFAGFVYLPSANSDVPIPQSKILLSSMYQYTSQHMEAQ
jgi:hypothetical protein